GAPVPACLLAFPTRRSSDLGCRGGDGQCGWMDAGWSRNRHMAAHGGTWASLSEARIVSARCGHVPRQVSGGSFRPPPRLTIVTADRKSTRLNSSHQIISYAV